METIRLTTVEQVISHSDIIAEALLNIPRDAGRPPEAAAKAIIGLCGKEDFGAWLQFRDELPLIFCTAYISTNVFGQRVGILWMLKSWRGADLRGFVEDVLRPWFKSFDVAAVNALDSTMTEAKARWFSRFGMKLAYHVYTGKTG